MPIRELRQTVHEDYKAKVSRWVATKAKARAAELVKGFAKAQY